MLSIRKLKSYFSLLGTALCLSPSCRKTESARGAEGDCGYIKKERKKCITQSYYIPIILQTYSYTALCKVLIKFSLTGP